MAAPALPEESSTIVAAPSALSDAITGAAPRSLNDPVGAMYSSFARHWVKPWPLPQAARSTTGVRPSPSDKTSTSLDSASAGR